MTRAIRHAPANPYGARSTSARRLVSRLVAFIALVSLVAASTGCSLIGLGVGAAVGASTDRWKTVDVDTWPASSGEVVQAHFVSPGHDRWVEGSYGGVRNGLLVLWTAEPACERREPNADAREKIRGNA